MLNFGHQLLWIVWWLFLSTHVDPDLDWTTSQVDMTMGKRPTGIKELAPTVLHNSTRPQPQAAPMSHNPPPLFQQPHQYNPPPLDQGNGDIIIQINGPISNRQDAEFIGNVLVKKLRQAGIKA